MAQQYRNTGLPGPTFLKSGGQHPSDHNAVSNGRAQLKSPSSNQQDVLASVFCSGKLFVQIFLPFMYDSTFADTSHFVFCRV
jgi:hypothetical protein